MPTGCRWTYEDAASVAIRRLMPDSILFGGGHRGRNINQCGMATLVLSSELALWTTVAIARFLSSDLSRS
jgi:hypothetical protein